jgi:hypothetical protein
MAVQQLAPLTLSDDERAELKSLTMRRKSSSAGVVDVADWIGHLRPLRERLLMRLRELLTRSTPWRGRKP